MRGKFKLFAAANQWEFQVILIVIAILILPPITIKSRIKIMGEKAKGRTFVRPLLVTRFIRLHRGAQKGDATNLGALSEPRREQNLSANPKRTAKSSSVC